MKPILSIIIPCYNHGQYIQETLDSIESANGKYILEIIIVNDGSTDISTISNLKEIQSKGYTVVNQQNSGLASARNNGIQLAKGKYILPLDSDNKVLKPYLNEAIDILEQNELVDIVYGNAIYFGEKTGQWIVGEYNLLKLIPDNFIDACAVYRKSVWEKLGGYDENMPIMGVEDWDFWLNASFIGFRFYYLNDNCFNYRVLNNSMIHSISDNDREIVKQYIYLKYNQHINLSSLEYYFGKKICNNYHFLIQNLTFNDIVKILFLKFNLRLKKLFK